MARRDRRTAARKSKNRRWKDSGLVWLVGGEILLTLAALPVLGCWPGATRS